MATKNRDVRGWTTAEIKQSIAAWSTLVDGLYRRDQTPEPARVQTKANPERDPRKWRDTEDGRRARASLCSRERVSQYRDELTRCFRQFVALLPLWALVECKNLAHRATAAVKGFRQL